MTPAENTATHNSSSTTSGIGEELSQDASRLSGTATDRAKKEADARKEQGTQAARSASTAINRAADELESDDNAPSWLSAAFRQTAGGIERLAGNLEGRSADQLAGDLSRFARENPGAFLAASAAAGFAAARFLRAGAEYKRDHRFDSQGDDGTSGSTTGNLSGAGSSGATPASGASSYGYASSSSLEPAGYGSNPVQGGAA